MNGHRHTDWDVRVSYATAAYNFTPHSVTKFAPHELMFGRLPQMDVDFSLPREEVPQDTPAHYLIKLTETMRHTFHVVRQHLKHAMELRRERYNKGIRTRRYKIGQAVALKQTNKLVGNDKLHDRYAGPYYILTIWDNGVVRIKLTARTKPKMVHVDRIEPWTCTNPTTPEWVHEAIKQFAPKKQEVGLQVELDYDGLSFASAISYTPCSLYRKIGQY